MAAQLEAKGTATDWKLDNSLKTSAASLTWRALAHLGRLVISRADEAEIAYRRPAVRAYPDSPRLCLTSLEFRGGDKPDAMRVSLDLWRMSVRVEARGPDAARASFLWRVARGVMDSALERNVIAAMHGGEPLAASSVLDAAGAAHVPIGAASLNDDASLSALSLSEDLRAVAGAELMKGNVVIAPTASVTVGKTSGTAAFYSVDPRTGSTTSLGPDGMHQGEYVLQVGNAVAFVGTIAFGLCGAFAKGQVSACCWGFAVLAGAILTILNPPAGLAVPWVYASSNVATAAGIGVGIYMCLPSDPNEEERQRQFERNYRHLPGRWQ